MKRAVLLANLQATKQHTERGEVLISRQKELIATLANIGCDTRHARRILQNLEEAQNTRFVKMHRMLNALDNLSATETDKLPARA
jgi:hypothetical protein